MAAVAHGDDEGLADHHHHLAGVHDLPQAGKCVVVDVVDRLDG
jgi:hypothetical protein